MLSVKCPAGNSSKRSTMLAPLRRLLGLLRKGQRGTASAELQQAAQAHESLLGAKSPIDRVAALNHVAELAGSGPELQEAFVLQGTVDAVCSFVSNPERKVRQLRDPPASPPETKLPRQKRF